MFIGEGGHYVMGGGMILGGGMLIWGEGGIPIMIGLGGNG